MRTFVSLLFILFSVAVFGQSEPLQKIGYADWDYIFGQMPEFKQIDSELKTHSAQLEAQLKAKHAEYQKKVEDYKRDAATMLDAIRQDKETELTQLQESIDKFQKDAQASLQKKQGLLMEPVFKKVGKAIEEVAKENGFAFILNPQLIGGGDVLLYNDEKYDISMLVLKKFGITPNTTTVVK